MLVPLHDVFGVKFREIFNQDFINIIVSSLAIFCMGIVCGYGSIDKRLGVVICKLAILCQFKLAQSLLL